MSVRVICSPYDSGHYGLRMGAGPQALWRALKPVLASKRLEPNLEEIKLPDRYPTEIGAAFAICRDIAVRVRACLERGELPIVLSGNCNAAIGTVSGCGCRDTGVVWFDAHGEATTPDTTTSGFLDGMGISTLTGKCWHTMSNSIPAFEPVPGRNILLVGTRDVEPSETKLLDEVGVVRASRPEDFCSAISAWAGRSRGVYIHIDLDVLDPTEGVANQWAVPGGWKVQDLVDAIRLIQAHTTVKAIGFGSYDPAADVDGRVLRAATSIFETIT